MFPLNVISSIRFYIKYEMNTKYEYAMRQVYGAPNLMQPKHLYKIDT